MLPSLSLPLSVSLLALVACSSSSERSSILQADENTTSTFVPDPDAQRRTPMRPAPMAAVERPARPTMQPTGEVDDDGWSTEIQWMSYDDGLARATAEDKPMMVVIYTGWCTHCRNYRREVLADPRVIQESEQFVMVRVNQDDEPTVAHRLAPDGRYIPRTIFLGPDGTIAEVDAGRDRYRYFFNEHDARELLRGMQTALRLQS